MTRSRKAAPNPLSQWVAASEVPVVDPPNQDRGVRRFRWYRRAVWSSVVLTPILVLALLISVSSTGGPAPVSGSAQVSSPGQGVATTRLWTWLPQVMPGARIVNWDGALPGPEPANDRNGVPVGPPTERELFVVADRNGNLYQAQVLVVLDPQAGPAVTDDPSLVPLPGSSSVGGLSDTTEWTGLVDGTAPQPVVDAVDTWAAAFTSGDRAKLRLAVADPDGSHAYLPLTGVASAAASVTRSATWPVADGQVGDGRMVVRAELTLVWAGHPADPTRSAAGVGYDLLVVGSLTASPRVVAWGGPGSGPTLTAFGNAVPTAVPTVTAAPVAPPTSATTNTSVTPAPAPG